MGNWNVLDLSTFNLKTLDRVFMALVTIVLERAWAALQCDQLPVISAYISLVRPTMDYGSIIWDFI